MEPNKFDPLGNSLKMGLGAEDQLIKIAASKNIRTKKSSPAEDMYDHFDYYFYQEDGIKKVEVKAMKKLSRSGSQQMEWIWVEFRNVNGYPGWVYGKADLIAFEFPDHFLFIKRKELVELSERLIDRNTLVQNSIDAKYKVYHRWNRPNELVGMIKSSDLLTLPYQTVWEKV